MLKPCDTSPYGACWKLYSCSLATNFRMQPIMPCVTGNFLFSPVMLPMPPKNTGSLNVMREKRPCVIVCFFVREGRKWKRERKKKEKHHYHHAWQHIFRLSCVFFTLSWNRQSDGHGQGHVPILENRLVVFSFCIWKFVTTRKPKISWI